MIQSTRTDVVTTYKSIRNLSACVEKRGELGWMVGCSLGGERWDEEGEIEQTSVGGVGIYSLLLIESSTDTFRRYTHRWQCHVIVRRSQFESLVILLVKSSEKIHVIMPLQLSKKNYIICQQYRRYIPTDVLLRYIPTVSLMGIVYRYIPT